MARAGRAVVGALIGLGVGILLFLLIGLLAEPNEDEWYITLMIFGAPILTGAITGVTDDDFFFEFWKLFLYPIAAALIVILVLFIMMIIYVFTTMTFFEALIICIVLGALSAPVGGIIVLIVGG